MVFSIISSAFGICSQIYPLDAYHLVLTYETRSIFIFLLAASSATLIILVIFLPETLRTIAGDGTFRLSGIHRPLYQRFVKEPTYIQDPENSNERGPTRPRVTVATFLKPLRLLLEKDILASLLFGGVVYAVWSMVVASTTSLFKDRFQLGELLLGLAFLPNGENLFYVFLLVFALYCRPLHPFYFFSFALFRLLSH